MSSWLKRLWRRYVTTSDIDENMQKVEEVLAEGKAREARAFTRIARSTGDPEAYRRARAADEEAEKFRREAVRLGVRVMGRR